MQKRTAIKLITAIVQPDKLHAIVGGVTGAGARGLTVTEVRGFGRQYGHLLPDVEAETGPWPLMLPKIRLDVVVHDEDVEAVIDAIAKCAISGTIGDGKIWVTELGDAIRVRTGERGAAAI